MGYADRVIPGQSVTPLGIGCAPSAFTILHGILRLDRSIVVIIGGYTRDSFIGALVVRQILICALAVGVVALPLALTSRNDGLWRSDTAPSTRTAAQPQQAPAPAPAAAKATALTREAAPPAVATIPPPATAPPAVPEQESQSEPDSAADDGEGDSGKMIAQRDRGTERSARSH